VTRTRVTNRSEIYLAFRIEELSRIEELATIVALISPCTIITTVRTSTLHESVGQEAGAGVTIWLPRTTEYVND
jgi:hypothetical protein